MTKKGRVAELLLSMTYRELEEVAINIESMQKLNEKWQPTTAAGKYGLMALLAQWADESLVEE